MQLLLHRLKFLNFSIIIYLFYLYYHGYPKPYHLMVTFFFYYSFIIFLVFFISFFFFTITATSNPYPRLVTFFFVVSIFLLLFFFCFCHSKMTFCAKVNFPEIFFFQKCLYAYHQFPIKVVLSSKILYIIKIGIWNTFYILFLYFYVQFLF